MPERQVKPAVLTSSDCFFHRPSMAPLRAINKGYQLCDDMTLADMNISPVTDMYISVDQHSPNRISQTIFIET